MGENTGGEGALFANIENEGFWLFKKGDFNVGLKGGGNLAGEAWGGGFFLMVQTTEESELWSLKTEGFERKAKKKTRGWRIVPGKHLRGPKKLRGFRTQKRMWGGRRSFLNR